MSKEIFPKPSYKPFSGSYLKSDVEFLVKVIDIDFTSIEEKERLIQDGSSHYSQMISREYEPSEKYLSIFYKAYSLNKTRFARDILTLAYNLSLKDDIVLVSLLRAGTPIGVLLKRTLRDIFDKDVNHYSISIIRDREIDNIALKDIYKNNPQSEFIFVDGWTGKGVINRELKLFVDEFNLKNSLNISNNLYVVSDIARVADFSVNSDDYLIPSSALNSTISGLVSRSILNDRYIKEGDYHGCRFYQEYAKSDLSLWFVDEIMATIEHLDIEKKRLLRKDDRLNSSINEEIERIQEQFGVTNINYIKPGIGESTRVLLRRVPYLIIVDDLKSKDIEHISVLANEKGVEVIENPNLPYRALAIIKDVLR